MVEWGRRRGPWGAQRNPVVVGWAAAGSTGLFPESPGQQRHGVGLRSTGVEVVLYKMWEGRPGATLLRLEEWVEKPRQKERFLEC